MDHVTSGISISLCIAVGVCTRSLLLLPLLAYAEIPEVSLSLNSILLLLGRFLIISPNFEEISIYRISTVQLKCLHDDFLLLFRG